MPSTSRLSDAANFAALLGVDARLAVLESLSAVPFATNGELSAATGLAAYKVTAALAALEDAGVVTANAPREVRVGRRVNYSVDREVLRARVQRLQYTLTQLVDGLG
ncbi:ArsR/SmtB family transcription factor [Leifsonia aquatica]|uniref:ArsR/SmtB family transcription factor n=1 Tax=Leifsonia aquatica TaxID=144185 RepID=UPI003822174B